MRRCEYIKRKTPSKNILEFLKHFPSRSHHKLFFWTTLYISCIYLSCIYLSCIYLSCIYLSCIYLSCIYLSCIYLSLYLFIYLAIYLSKLSKLSIYLGADLHGGQAVCNRCSPERHPHPKLGTVWAQGSGTHVW